MDKKNAKTVLSRMIKHYGEVTPDLAYNDLYQLTIAVVLSAQTTDKQVNAVTPHLFSGYPDFKSLANADISEVEEIVKSTGFYRNKARNIVTLSQIIVKYFNGMVPSDLESLMELPGVGRKSANVILSLGYNTPALAVDTHVTRIANRLGFIKSDDPEKVEKALTALIPASQWRLTHLLFIAHGRRICSARNPACYVCPVEDLCAYGEKNLPRKN